jgi:serine/threonine protein kinase
MATGTLPFRGDTSGVILEAIMNRRPVPPVRLNPDLPAKLEDVISKALEKDRNFRYRSSAEIRTDLQRLKRDTSGLRAEPATTQPASKGLGGEVLATAPPVAASASLRRPLDLMWLAVGLTIAAGIAILISLAPRETLLDCPRGGPPCSCSLGLQKSFETNSSYLDFSLAHAALPRLTSFNFVNPLDAACCTALRITLRFCFGLHTLLNRAEDHQFTIRSDVNFAVHDSRDSPFGS